MSKERLPNKRVLFRCMACDEKWRQDVFSDWCGDLLRSAKQHQCEESYFPTIIVAAQADLTNGAI